MFKNLIVLTITAVSLINYTQTQTTTPKVEEQKEDIVEYSIPMIDPKTASRSEEDIYDANRTETIEQIALKAVKINYEGFTFYYLTDLQGSSYLSKENLEHGKNYVGFVAVDNKELISFIESSFLFSYEEDWQDDKLLHDEIEYNLNERKIEL